MPVRIDKLNNVWARVVWLGKAEGESTYANPLSYLDNNFAIYVPNYQFSKSFINRRVTKYDGKHHLFKKDYGALPMGLVKEAYKLLKDSDFLVTVDDAVKESFKDSSYSKEKTDEFVRIISEQMKAKVGYVPYDYQIRALHKTASSKRVLFESPTGSGKSLTLYLIIRYLLAKNKNNPDFKILISVPSRVLVTQMFRDFKDYGWDSIEDHVGQYSSDFSKEEREINVAKKVLVSTNDSIDNLLSKDKNFCNNYSAVFVDEAHKAKEPEESKRLFRILSSCENAEYRVAMTGTVPKNKLFEKNLEGSFGEKLILTETNNLQEQGILSNCTIYNIHLPYDYDSIKFMKTKKVSYADEVELVRLSGSKHYAISYLIDQKLITTKENTLILCNKIENGELKDIVNHISKNHPEFEIEIIHGGVKGKDRDRIITSINNREGVIVVATYATMSTGVNIKKLHNCIFASSIKSYETIIQSIGRALRTHNSKSEAKIFDLVDDICIEKRTGTMWRSYVNTQWTIRETYYVEKKFPIINLSTDKTFSVLNIDYELTERSVSSN